MKNALLLTTIWVGILFAAYAIVYWDQGIDEPFPISVLDQETEMSYVDPQGYFSLAVPLGWDVAEGEAVVELVPPEADLEGWIVAVESDDLEAALDAAWEMADPEFVGDPVSLEPLELENGADDAVIAVYDGDETSETIYGIAQSSEGHAVVLLVRGSSEVAEAYAEDLEAILRNLAVPAYEAILL